MSTLALGMLGPVLAPTTADAAAYTVWSCRAADGTPIGTDAWRASGTAGVRSDDCATGGALRATLGQGDTGDGEISGWQFTPPRGVTIERYRLWRAAVVPGTSTAFAAGVAAATGLGGATFGDGCLLSDGAVACGDGSLTDPADPGNDTGDQTGSFPGLTIAARCVAACAATADPAASVALYRSAVDLTDDAAPVVGPAVGTLFDPGALPGRRSLFATVADEGGGVARTELLIDGAVVQSAATGGSCVEPYATMVPCANRTDRGFVVDTSGLAAGAHSAVIRAVDAAGNVTDGPATPFVVAPPVVLPPPPPPFVPTLRLMELDLPDEVSTPRKGWDLGTARWSDGSPAAGAPLDVYAAPVGGGADELEWLKRITVDADGTFTIPKSSFSRSLRIQPADATNLAAPVDVRVVAPLKVRMRKPKRAVRNGTTTTLRGTIRGAGDAVDGMTVLVQAVVDGRWSTVDTVEASDSGAVSWKYRFRRTVRAAQYRFRLVVPSVRNLPWERTASPRQVVRVVPGGASRR
ncbi:MAG: hypothetical protein ITG02_10625 [Patulibacter sp.]|nr:hypothetical protein [Patulibacter sp.]